MSESYEAHALERLGKPDWNNTVNSLTRRDQLAYLRWYDKYRITFLYLMFDLFADLQSLGVIRSPYLLDFIFKSRCLGSCASRESFLL